MSTDPQDIRSRPYRIPIALPADPAGQPSGHTVVTPEAAERGKHYWCPACTVRVTWVPQTSVTGRDGITRLRRGHFKHPHADNTCNADAVLHRYIIATLATILQAHMAGHAVVRWEGRERRTCDLPAFTRVEVQEREATHEYDLALYADDRLVFVIEVYHHHRVDTRKAERLTTPWIEVDARHLLGEDVMRTLQAIAGGQHAPGPLVLRWARHRTGQPATPADGIDGCGVGVVSSVIDTMLRRFAPSPRRTRHLTLEGPFCSQHHAARMRQTISPATWTNARVCPPDEPIANMGLYQADRPVLLIRLAGATSLVKGLGGTALAITSPHPLVVMHPASLRSALAGTSVVVNAWAGPHAWQCPICQADEHNRARHAASAAACTRIDQVLAGPHPFGIDDEPQYREVHLAVHDIIAEHDPPVSAWIASHASMQLHAWRGRVQLRREVLRHWTAQCTAWNHAVPDKLALTETPADVRALRDRVVAAQPQPPPGDTAIAGLIAHEVAGTHRLLDSTEALLATGNGRCIRFNELLWKRIRESPVQDMRHLQAIAHWARSMAAAIIADHPDTAARAAVIVATVQSTIDAALAQAASAERNRVRQEIRATIDRARSVEERLQAVRSVAAAACYAGAQMSEEEACSYLDQIVARCVTSFSVDAREQSTSAHPSSILPPTDVEVLRRIQRIVTGAVPRFGQHIANRLAIHERASTARDQESARAAAAAVAWRLWSPVWQEHFSRIYEPWSPAKAAAVAAIRQVLADHGLTSATIPPVLCAFFTVLDAGDTSAIRTWYHRIQPPA